MTETDLAPEVSPAPAKPRRLRWLLPAAALVAWLFIGGPLGQYAGLLSEVQENDNASFLPADAESTQVAELAGDFAADDLIPAVVVYEFDRAVTPEDLAEISADVAAIAQIDGVVGEPIGPVPSETGEAVQVIVPLDGSDEPRRSSRPESERDRGDRHPVRTTSYPKNR